MFAKVFSPDDPRSVTAPAWRQVGGAPAADAVTASPEVQPDFGQQVAQLRQEFEERVREARAAGARDSEEAGRRRAAAEVETVVGRLSQTIAEIAAYRPRLRREAEADTVKLALAIARRVLRRELAIDPDALHGLLRAALEKLEGQEIARVRVHPSQSGTVSARLREWAPASVIEVISDASREPGTVIFETGRGNLDASVESQLQEIERGLADCLRKQS